MIPRLGVCHFPLDPAHRFKHDVHSKNQDIEHFISFHTGSTNASEGIIWFHLNVDSHVRACTERRESY